MRISKQEYKWVAIPFSRGSSQPRDRAWVSCITEGFFIVWATRERSPFSGSIKTGHSMPISHRFRALAKVGGGGWAVLGNVNLDADRQDRLGHFHVLTAQHHLLDLVNLFSSVQSLSRVWLFATPWTAAHQASLSISNSQSLLKLMAMESLMPSNHLTLCHPLLFLSSICPSIRVFPNESVLPIRWPKYWSISPSASESGLISFRMDWLDLLGHSFEGDAVTVFGLVWRYLFGGLWGHALPQMQKTQAGQERPTW